MAGHALALVDLSPTISLDWVCPGHLPRLLGKLPDAAGLFSATRGEHQEALAAFWDLVHQGMDARRELQLQTLDGEHWFRLHAMHGVGADGQPFLVLNLEDIDSELTGEQEKIERRRKETIQSMAAGIAHEFNNYLTPIRGFIELTMDALGEEHPSTDGLRTALTQAEACAELVKQIMFSSSKSLLNLRKVNLSTLLSNLVIDAVHVLKIDTAAIEIRQRISQDMPAIWIDHEMFRQAIRHLIHNAVLAMPRGGVLTVSAEGAKAGKPGDTDFVLIEIIDTGEGIRTEHMGKIFDPFFTTRNRAEARGMGLPMVQGMVTQMGGWIEIQSAPGKGTRVAMHLPTQAPGQKTSSTGVLRDEDGTRAVAVIPTGRMLVADDEDYVLKLISRVFSKEGWDITEATSFYEVLNSLETRKEHYDVLILDVSMPGPSAEETLRRILDAGCKAHILLVSGLPGSERMDRLIKQSNGIFISKPFSLGNLVDRVEKLMASG